MGVAGCTVGGCGWLHVDSMEREESGQVNCSVCYKSVLSRDAEVHVDACLREASLRATQHGSPLAQTGADRLLRPLLECGEDRKLSPTQSGGCNPFLF